jgi:hypothetical protein
MSADSENNKWKDIPNGGFPNIYKIETVSDSKQEEGSKKKREWKGPDIKIVNVKEILTKKRHVNPFISLDNEK